MFCRGKKTVLDLGFQITYKNGDFCAISAIQLYIGKSDETPPKNLSTDSQTTVDWFYPQIG